MILRYIKGTLHFALGIISQSPCRLYGYSNADREVVSQLGDQLQTSKKQTTVARSSAEAEYRALAFIAAEITWILYLLDDIEVIHLSGLSDILASICRVPK
uniref:Uncharacterized protein n=1 Tax=Solanum lycopersicum TaxID=4081 RepID=A0A3Q7G4F1_SOLLC